LLRVNGAGEAESRQSRRHKDSWTEIEHAITPFIASLTLLGCA
jgi:hypothetical protein